MDEIKKLLSKKWNTCEFFSIKRQKSWVIASQKTK